MTMAHLNPPKSTSETHISSRQSKFTTKIHKPNCRDLAMLCGKFWFELIGIPHSQQNYFSPLPARLITQLLMEIPGSHAGEATWKPYNSLSTHHRSPRGLVYHRLTHTLDATSISISQTYGFCYRPVGYPK